MSKEELSPIASINLKITKNIFVNKILNLYIKTSY